ncbi:MAG: hypothetical protein WD871_10590 [Xanthobacteraceae bacterium]
MLCRNGLLAIVVAASTAAAAQTSPEPTSGTAFTSEMLRPQPLEQRPTLQAPTTATDSLSPQPEYPMPLQAQPAVPAPLMEQPVGEAEAIAVEPAWRAETVPEPAPRPAMQRPYAGPSERPTSSVRAASRRAERPARVERGRASRRTGAAGRPLGILPSPARPYADPSPPQTAARAFAPETPPTYPWPFAPARVGSRFNVPAGWW